MEPNTEEFGNDTQDNKENIQAVPPERQSNVNTLPPVPIDQIKKKLPPVEIVWSSNPKPYLGGFKSLKTGLVYHHAFAQTDQIPRDHKTKFHRDVKYKNII